MIASQYSPPMRRMPSFSVRTDSSVLRLISGQISAPAFHVLIAASLVQGVE